IDDILGLIILSIVASLAKNGEFSVADAVKTGLIGFGVWLSLLFGGIYGRSYISKYILEPFNRSGMMPIMALSVAILISYLVTLVGLHPVVGAYVGGLMFAATREREGIIRMT